jgi:CheY-like chemotaxis protein
MRKILGHRFIVVEALNGEDALALLRRMEGVVSLVITDYDLMIIDGLGLARHVKQQFPTVPVLLMSSEISKSDCAPAISFLRKPFMP